MDQTKVSAATVASSGLLSMNFDSSATKDRSISDASALVHEIRNPLTNINLSIEMLNSAIQDKELKVYLDIIVRSSARINHLMNDVLKSQEAGDRRSGLDYL